MKKISDAEWDDLMHSINLDADEISQLRADIDRTQNICASTQVELDGADKVIVNLKSLLTRAADALVQLGKVTNDHKGSFVDFIAELRRAAE